MGGLRASSYLDLPAWRVGTDLYFVSTVASIDVSLCGFDGHYLVVSMSVFAVSRRQRNVHNNYWSIVTLSELSVGSCTSIGVALSSTLT